jgi:hypothetical protein
MTTAAKKTVADKNWSYAVTHRPAATFPPPGTFTKKARDIYLIMRDPKISPNGLGSAIQMTVFFINRAGKRLPEANKKELSKAVEMLRIELAYLKQAHECGLEAKPKPVFPLPPESKRVGGRYAKRINNKNES